MGRAFSGAEEEDLGTMPVAEEGAVPTLSRSRRPELLTTFKILLGLAPLKRKDVSSRGNMSKIYIKDNGSWKTVLFTYLKQDGSWIKFPIGGAPTVDTPSIVTPASGSVLPNRGSFQATSSAFVVLNGSDTHKSSSWQLSLNQNFSTIAWELLDSTTSKTSVTVPSGVLDTSGAYYLRVKYTGNSGVQSEWSSPSLVNSPVITPSLSITQNLSPTLSVTASNAYTFTLNVVDTANRNTTLSYQWYFGGQPAGPNSPSWTINPFYYSDNTKQIYCVVTGTNNGLSSSVTSQTCTLNVTRSSQEIRTNPDINSGFKQGSFKESAVSSTRDNGNWSDCQPKGVFIAQIPSGQGRLVVQSGQTWQAAKNNNTAGGTNCNPGIGINFSVSVRLALRVLNGCRTSSWNDSTCTLSNTDDYGQTINFGGSQGTIEYVDLDPSKQYEIYYECKNDNTVDRCTCNPPGTNNFQNCSRGTEYAFWDFQVNSDTRWNYTEIQYKDDTRPTPTPP